MSRRFADQVVVVTGGAAGLGRACARRFAEEGARVVIADIDGDRGAQVAEELSQRGGRASSVPVDVGDEVQVQAMVEHTLSTWGHLDVLHNNAADLRGEVHGRDRGVVDMDAAVWDQTMAVNLRGTMLCCKHAVPAMVERGGGAIVNTSSVSALIGEQLHLAYACSKAALLALTRHVANMHGDDGIRCNAVAPGLMLTELARERLSGPMLAAFRAERLLERAAEPEDVANLVTFLASEDAACITGQTYVIDGGTTAKRPRQAIRSYLDALGRGAVRVQDPI